MNKGWRRFGIVGLSTLVATTAITMTGIAATSYAAASGSMVSAVLPTTGFSNTALVAALPGATGVSLGTQTFAETTAGELFGAANSTTHVTLTLSGTSTFTAGVTATITVPTGYSTPAQPLTTAAGTYSFDVLSPDVPVQATVTVSGLTILASATETAVTLAASGMSTAVPAVPVVNVVNFNERTGGDTRYETAAALFDSEFSGATDVVLSSGVSFPDALSASYLAGAFPTGTLLTAPTALSAAARKSIISSGVDTVYITGGTGAVSQGVENTIKAMHVGDVFAAGFVKVERIGGDNRYETNLLVNEFFPSAPDTVLLASGKDFPDALALGPVAYQGFPLILTGGITLGDTENAQLFDFDPANVVIAGGIGVVSKAIEDSLKGQGFTVLRLAGNDRTLTASAIAAWATDGIAGAGVGSIGAAQGAVSDTTYIATGTGFADALAAGPVAGINGRMIVLSKTPTVLGLGIPAYLGTKTVGATVDSHTEVGTLHALGETGAVSAPLMKEAAATIGR